ncbi:hypothetical protein MMC13_005134 [Lambiella insularis]|nr:hypothetical protein [Lambiella insularis]
MAPNIVHLPDGQTLTVTPVFGGLFFKANELNTHHATFPPGWTVILQSEDDEEAQGASGGDDLDEFNKKVHRTHMHRYRRPTLQHDALFLSSISNPSNSDFKPAISPSRQIAMMLWATLWWYFHQPAPSRHITTASNSNIPEAGRPTAEWRINIKREGIFKGRHILSKLERMGLISTENSSVGTDIDDRGGEGWTEMFVSQRSFWQLDGRIFLFALMPTNNSPFPPGTPHGSRPGSPSREGNITPVPHNSKPDNIAPGLWSPTTGTLANPFASASHLPTFYPPPPAQYILSNGVRHPIRPKPPRQGETFYTRYIPSLGQYLSFRVASLSTKSTSYQGPVGSTTSNFLPLSSAVNSTPASALPSIGNIRTCPCDTDLLHDWMNNPRVAAAWGVTGPIATQEAFLRKGLTSRHSFPAIGCWDGKPFGYFEIYWVKEDQLGKHLNGSETGNWDRGIHVLVGEEEFRGKDRVRVWLSGLVHYCWLADERTERIFCEPRLDNQKFIGYLQDVGFYKEREVAFPYKQSALMRMNREAWDAPVL